VRKRDRCKVQSSIGKPLAWGTELGGNWFAWGSRKHRAGAVQGSGKCSVVAFNV